MMKQKLVVYGVWIKQHLKKWALIIGGFIVIVATYLAVFFPKAVEFAYGSSTCVSQLTFMPKTLQEDETGTYKLEPSDEIKVFNYPVAAKKVCVVPISAPMEGEERIGLSPFGWIVAKKTFIVTIPKAPVVSTTALEKPLPASKSLQLPLSEPDVVFTYKMAVEDRTVECESTDAGVDCHVPTLKLEQGSSYAVQVQRYFDGHKVETIAKTDVTTLPAVTIDESSIQNDQTVYDTPEAFTFTASKKLTSAKVTLIKQVDDETTVPVTATVRENIVSVQPKEPLERPAHYRLVVEELDAVDGSALAEPHTTAFTISDGPKVTGVSVGASGISRSATIVLSMDQPIADSEDVTKYVSVAGAPTQITKQAGKIYIRLINAPACADIAIRVAKGMKNSYGVASTQDWSYTSRTICHTVATIGYSVEGRPINAYYFGSGAKTVLYMGAIHGNELSSKYIMDKWVVELEARAREIPADKRIVVIPVVNPDGAARGARNNVNGVNLNRNFATSNWTADTVVSGGRTEQGAGGSAPGSEQETKVLSAFTNQLQPQFVVTYHSLGSLVNSNDVGSSVSLGQQYARLARYRYVSNASTTAVFGFDMTGTYEDWLLERGVPALLIELNTNTGNHFSQNQSAMWLIVSSY